MRVCQQFFYGAKKLDNLLDQFEAEYGIKVVETTYESNDELLAKLIAGKEGEYDIAVPTNTYIQAFKDNDLLEPFDEGAITNLGNIDDAYLGLVYDASATSPLVMEILSSAIWE